MRRSWRLDDWFRAVGRDGTPLAGSTSGPAYDRTPPFWFRQAFWVGQPINVLLIIGAATRDLRLVVPAVVGYAVLLVATVVWARQHRVDEAPGPARRRRRAGGLRR